MKGRQPRWRPLLIASLLLPSLAFLGFPGRGAADSAYKVPTANPAFTRGARVRGTFTAVQTSNDVYMQVREGRSGGVRYLDMSWNGWEAFTEAPESKLLGLEVELEGYQSNAGDTWFLGFYDFDSGAWYATWYPLGALPTAPDGTLLFPLADPLLARRFVGAGGQFRLRIADGNTVNGGADGTRTDMYIDLLRARFVYDVTPPSSAVTAPADGAYTNASSYTVQGTSSDAAPDPSGVAQVEVSLDGGMSWTPATPSSPGDYSTWYYDWAAIPGEGVYVIRSRATDAVANVESPALGSRLIVDWTPPQVAETAPAGGATNVGVATNVQARFSEANGMDEATIDTASFTLTDEAGTPVAGSVGYDAGTMTATFYPDADLFYGYVYTATLTTDIRDAAGNPLPATYSWTFRTADILSLSLSETYNRDGTPGGGSVDFGAMSPEGSPYVVGGGSPPYAARLWVLSSTRWNIQARASSDLVDNTQVPPAVIPIARLQWALAGTGAWNPFGLSGAEMFSPARDRTPQPGGESVDLDLRLDLEWEDGPGDYSTDLVFILMEEP